MDNQLPSALVRWLAARSDAVHVLNLGMDAASDWEIWNLSITENRIVVSKDEDFFHLANRPNDPGRLLWVRLGNCRTAALLTRFESGWAGIEQEFASGQQIVELR